MNYTRTQAGTAAVLNPKIDMPRPMKALLISMIGDFDAHLYASRLRVEQNVPAILEALVRAGYICALPDTGSPYLGPAEAQVTRPVFQPGDSETLSDAVSYRPLQDAVADITDFVMRHLPEDALEISFALEGLTSAAQLEASLHAYQARILHLGADAELHLAKLKRILGHASSDF